MAWTVDIPTPGRDEWTEIASAETRAQAIQIAQDLYGADDDGNVCLVAGPHGVNDEDDEEVA